MRQLSLAAILLVAANSSAGADPPAAVDPNVIARGRELFLKVWQPNKGKDAAGPGDGLGPVFNDTSCVACHSLGGIGGAGAAEHNVRVVTLSGSGPKGKMQKLHPGFSKNASLVLHHSGVDRQYAAWHARILKNLEQPAEQPQEIAPQLQLAEMAFQQGLERQAGALASISFAPEMAFVVDQPPAIPITGCFCNVGNHARSGGSSSSGWGSGSRVHSESRSAVALTVSERNSTALFGAGLIDRIPEAAIEAAAALQQAQSPKTAGRIATLPNKRIGRFGWHSQQASLTDFALTACAVELGLAVPGHPQAGNPLKPKYKAPGVDMTAEQCAALVAFLAALPRPVQPQAADPPVQEGRKLFDRIGCSDCHLQNLGDVNGLYSDLLLHNMGAALRAGGYGAFVPEAPADQPAGQSWHGDLEWRTPPLWGVASSAPYLHDGRADTLRDAILLHGGQAQESADNFRKLPPADQQGVLTFLNSLTAPPMDSLTRVPERTATGRQPPKPGRVAAKGAPRAGNRVGFDRVGRE